MSSILTTNTNNYLMFVKRSYLEILDFLSESIWMKWKKKKEQNPEAHLIKMVNLIGHHQEASIIQNITV